MRRLGRRPIRRWTAVRPMVERKMALLLQCPSAQAHKRQDGEHDDDQTDKIDNVSHGFLPNGDQTRRPDCGSAKALQSAGLTPLHSRMTSRAAFDLLWHR